MVYEGTIRWGLDETTQGDAAGGGAFGQAPGRAQPGSQAQNDDHQVVRGARPEGPADSTALRPALQRKSPRPHLRRLRRPRCLAVDRPGALVQMDSKQVRMANGKTVFEFGAIDCFTRKRVVGLAPRPT